MQPLFIKFLVPVIEESKVFNRRTSRRFLDCMMHNLERSKVPNGGIELSLKREGYKLEQVSYMLGRRDTQLFCGEFDFKMVPTPEAEYWLSYTPGLFSNFLRLSLDMSYKGYTKDAVDEVVNSCRVSQKVKTQALKVAHQLIDDEDVVLSLGAPVNIPFANKLRVYCCPRLGAEEGHTSYSEILNFSKKTGVSEDLSILKDAHKYNLECYYISFIVGRKGIEQSISVELATKKSKELPSALDFLKEAGLANDTHYPESQNGFHHMKLTFKKGKITPKLYFSLGYAKRNDPIPKAFQSGNPVDVIRTRESPNSSRVSRLRSDKSKRS